MPPAGWPTNCEPSEVGRSWKGGARERADDVFFATGIKRRRSKADFAPTWRRRRDLNPRDGFPPYSLSRGAPSATWVLLRVRIRNREVRKWRREWDSNPRLLRVTGFQDRLLTPLGHLSTSDSITAHEVSYHRDRSLSRRNRFFREIFLPLRRKGLTCFSESGGWRSSPGGTPGPERCPPRRRPPSGSGPQKSAG